MARVGWDDTCSDVAAGLDKMICVCTIKQPLNVLLVHLAKEGKVLLPHFIDRDQACLAPSLTAFSFLCIN